MAKLSAEERYEAAMTEAQTAYVDALSECKQYLIESRIFMEKRINTIKSYNSIHDDIVENAQTCNKTWENANLLTNVVVIGIMNHGKSTMLNALIKDEDDSTFKVADRRETQEIQHKECDGICWTDTPGFDADEADDNKALEGITQLEVGLFVHKASTGELHANEVEVLHKLANKREEAFLKNTCIVLNDDISDDEKLEFLLDRIDTQLKDFLGRRLEIFPCNPKSYQKGLRENKKILMGKSGITELRDWIEERCHSLNAEKDHRQDQTSRVLEPKIRQKCKTAIEKLEEGIQDIEEQIQVAAICSEKLHVAIKEINRNKDRMRTLRKEVIDSAGMFGGLMSVFGGANSDFDEEHNTNMGTLNHYVVDLNENKNEIVESIRESRERQNDFQESIQEMQEIYESWE